MTHELVSPRRLRRLPIALLLALVGGLLLGVPTAFAHAQLLSSHPAAGAVLAESPKNITVAFSETIEISLGAIRVFDGTGSIVNTGVAHHPNGHADQVSVDLPKLANGSYVVDWQVVSADSHPVHAAYTFQIGPTSTLTSGLLDQIIGRDHSSRPAGIGLAISRALVAGTIAIVLGGLTAVALGIVVFTRRVRLLVLISAVVGAIAGALALPFEVAYATGRSLGVITDALAWSAVLDSRVGIAWAVRAAIIGVVGVALTLTVAQRQRLWWRLLLGAGLLGVGLASAFGGHGATGRWQAVGVTATVLHVGAVAVWLGGLVTVLLSFREIDDTSVRRFSSLALGSVAVIAFSGVVQAFRQVGSFDALTNTSYGTLLIWKTVGVVAVVVVASVSRHATLGKLFGRSDGEMVPVDRPRLRRAIIIEAVLAVAILTVTSLLMAANPSRTDSPNPFSATLVSNNYLASVVVSPGRAGSNIMHIYISSPGSSLDVPDSVDVRISDPSRAVDPITIEVTRAGAGHYTTNDALFPYAAHWKLQISAIYHQFDKVQWETTVNIR